MKKKYFNQQTIGKQGYHRTKGRVIERKILHSLYIFLR